MASKLNVLVYNPAKTASYVGLLREKAPKLNLLVCESKADIKRLIEQADILFVSTRFPAETIARASRLKWIQTMGAGVERFTKDVTVPAGIVLTRVTTGFGEKISEYVMGYMLALTQRMRDVFKNQRDKRWEPLDYTWLCGETLGIAGVGAIGSAIAKKARYFGMRVIGFDLVARENSLFDASYGREQLLEFVAQPRYLSINLPLTLQTEGMFDTKVFEAMREDSIIINTTRGPVVREEDLIRALEHGLIGGAILDVFEEEPLPTDSPLWDMENVIVTPHHAGPSVPEEMVAFFLENAERWRRGETLWGLVNQEKGF